MSYITIKKWTVATVQVVYYIPAHLHIVNECMCRRKINYQSTLQLTRFLDYWDKNIDGPIKEVYIYDHEEAKVRHVDRRLKIN